MTGAGPMDGYWPSPWPGEDAGPHRRAELGHGSFGNPNDPVASSVVAPRFEPGMELDVVSRLAPACTMVVVRDPGEVFLLRHTAGDDAISFVERLDPETLEPRAQSAELAGGPTWPGGLAAHANGSLHVVFGNHAHRLDADLAVVASAELPRVAPYNSFVILPDGHLVTKDFGGSRPGAPVAAADRRPCELVVLEPERLEIVARLALPEPSIARLSADGSDVYVVGDTSLMRVRWDGSSLALGDFVVPYRTMDGQTFGWDCVIAAGAAWFLDDGDGSEQYTGTLRGHGVSTAPLHLVRVDLASGGVTMAEVCGQPGGLIANPPVVDEQRGIALGYDTGNGVVTAFDIGPGGSLTPRWQRQQDHGSHLVLLPDAGQVVTGDHDGVAGEHLVVLDIETGDEVVRVPTGSPVQSVLFPAIGWDGELYLCSFTTVSRVSRRAG